MEALQIIQIKQVIKIFLASSKELSNDRNALGNLVRRLNKTYEKRGIRLDLFEWEDYDAAYNNKRKQDEYDDQIRDSDMFLALFRTWAGKYTIEEFDVAVEEFRRTGKKPKNYVYIRDLFEGEVETDELTAFKRRLSDEMGYYWISYNNNDSMQLHFVMQLQLVEGNYIDSLKVENGEVKLEDMTIAQMGNLRFAAGNDDYQRMSKRLSELPELIEKARLHVENYPNEEDFKNELQKLLNERNQLQKDFDEQQQLLFNTALRITRLQGDRITDRMHRAIETFEEGKVHEANIILDETEHDANCNLIKYHHSKELTEQWRQNVIYSIEELLLKTSTMMADISIPIDERIKQTKGLYEQADQLAIEVEYDKKKYSYLLFNYESFLNNYGLYPDAESICLLLIKLNEELYGKEHENTATSYNNIGMVYQAQGKYTKALECHNKALVTFEKVYGSNHPNIAVCYNNIGGVYDNMGNHQDALEYYFKSLSIQEKHHEEDNPDIATCYNNIGGVYMDLDDYTKALDYYLKAFLIIEKKLGLENPKTATSFNNISEAYLKQSNYPKAIEYLKKAIEIYESINGVNHPATATAYSNIGVIYGNQGNHTKALEFNYKALATHEKTYGVNHPDTAQDYNNIGVEYYELGAYEKALEHYFKALAIRQKVLVPEHSSIAQSYACIAEVYRKLGDTTSALSYYDKALAINEKFYGTNNIHTAIDYGIIGEIYEELKQYSNALEYFKTKLKIDEAVVGTDHRVTIEDYNRIADIYDKQDNYDKALEYYIKRFRGRGEIIWNGASKHSLLIQ